MIRFTSNIKLQRLHVAALLLLLLPAITVQAWLSFETARRAAANFEAQLAGEVSERVFDKVLRFFEIPNRVVRFNVEQFRAGLLDIDKPHEMQRNFLLQLEQEPMLTFVSIGTAGGEYYAASHPPFGEERGLRMVQSTAAEGHVITHYAIDADNRRGAVISKDSAAYDPRIRPWFKSVLGQTQPRWYGAYRYAPYEALGIGVAAPLHSHDGKFLGVVTADVALLQLSQLFASITKDLGGTAFLFDEGGGLLATSTEEAIYALKGSQTVRVQGKDSPNPLIAAASRIILADGAARGRTAHVVNGERYLIDWRQHALTDGPTITMVSILPQSQFDALPRDLIFNVLSSSLLIILTSLVLAIFVSRWVSRPLVELAAWANSLGRGEHPDIKRERNPINEIDTLSNALQSMAHSIWHHTEHLEREVAVRTAELELANAALAERSNTDGLTGLANRRHFDECLAMEVARARRNKETLALIMLDVDHFKAYNDRYGHLEGDHCLIRVAEVLKRLTQRPGDLAARYGGEEFAIIAAHCSLKETQTLAEMLRQQIERSAIEHVGSPYGLVTASVGLAVLVPDAHAGAAQLIAMADKALYCAKEQGRNRVEVGSA